jgi:DNA polymerase-3 subunit delta
MNYILYGELYPMIRKHLNKILKERLGDVDDFNVVKIDFEESSLDEVEYEASSLPLGYDKKAVVVDNSLFLTKDVDDKDEEKALEILEKSSDDIDLIFILRSDKVNKSGKIFNYVKENGQVFEFLNIEKEQWPLYIRKYFKNKNVEITSEAINELSNRVDGDLTKFMNEADKLCLYKNSITLADVVLMVAKPLEDDAFQMSNALFRGENDLAISIYRDIKLLDSRSADALVPMLASQFRFISQVLYLDSRGLEKEEIAKELNVSPVRVKIALKNSRNISRKEIANALDKLYNLDFQIKSGQIDRSYGFELFLINFPN